MNANIRSCKRCGSLYQSFGTDYCQDCTEELDNMLTEIEDYLYEHEGAGVVEISNKLNISAKVILDFIKDGSLILSEGNYAVFCEKCGKPIASGRYCDECREDLGNVFDGVIAGKKEQEPEPEKKNDHSAVRMHIKRDRWK